MLLFPNLREYERSTPWPERSSIHIQLKPDLALTLNIPNFGVVASTDDAADPKSSLTRVVRTHAEFHAAMHPDLSRDDTFYKTCTAEVNAVSLFFPGIKDDGIRIAFTAWLAFACVMDDVLETLDSGDAELVLVETIEILRHAPGNALQHSAPLALRARDRRVQARGRMLLDHCTGHLSRKSSEVFFQAVCEVLEAHIEEIYFLQGGYVGSLAAYMSIRSRTISLNPFFEVIKSEYLSEADWKFNDAWKNLQNEVSRVAGLQNDLIGLVRDIEEGEQLNAVMVLMQGVPAINKSSKTYPDPDVLSRCVAMVNAEHNQSAGRCLELAAQVHRAAEVSGSFALDRVETVAQHILMMCETHLRWCSSAKRYRLELGLNETKPQQAQRKPTPAPVSSQQVVIRCNGILHGLPTFPDTSECRNLTALVTGATGLSGYHMVKALAASPQRWSKIYCLSSRPPPSNFFDDLGEGAQRVEHIAIDFLGDPSEIACRLREKVQHVDHIFYFSYLHPAPKGDVLDLWANADELSTINMTLFANFIAAIHQTAIKPRRFMLQTGTKHYAFYLGPTSVPAFESDPRVQLDRNFYYEQEDALAAYCQSTGAAWNVARPNYIVGAVQDGTLNHLIGFGIYAAVQAHLGQPILFPGDYRAWDREHVQSTGLLNAYFEEWLVLTEKAANEAFNIHDGLSFTWGRLWPYLAQWYKTLWSPPEEDEDKYRVMRLPYPKTPRGYGPQATLRSTFSLLEWSLQPEIESAWKELAKQHGLVLDPFDDRHRARIFSFSDSAVIGDAPMTTSVRKAREFGFFGTVDTYRSIFDAFHDLARLKLIPAPAANVFTA